MYFVSVLRLLFSVVMLRNYALVLIVNYSLRWLQRKYRKKIGCKMAVNLDYFLLHYFNVIFNFIEKEFHEKKKQWSTIFLFFFYLFCSSVCRQDVKGVYCIYLFHSGMLVTCGLTVHLTRPSSAIRVTWCRILKISIPQS